MMVVWLSLALAQSADDVELDFTCVLEGAVAPARAVAPAASTCGIEASNLYAWDVATWRFGDGSVAEGDSVTHVYDAAGRYDVWVVVEGLRYSIDLDAPPLPERIERRVNGLVTVCDIADPRFSYAYDGGRTYRMLNQSRFVVGCVDAVRWTLHQGDDPRSEPVAESTLWDPVFELPEDEGTYTALLTLDGPAGDAAAVLTFEAKFGASDAFEGFPTYASPTAPAGGFALVGVVAPLWWRRRR